MNESKRLPITSVQIGSVADRLTLDERIMFTRVGCDTNLLKILPDWNSFRLLDNLMHPEEVTLAKPCVEFDSHNFAPISIGK